MDAAAVAPDGRAAILPLLCAARAGNRPAAAAHLARHPSHVNALDESGGSAVHWAALNGDERMLCLLLDAGGRVDLPADRSAMQPLHWACTTGHVEVAAILLSRRGDVNALDARCTSPLMIAAQYGHRDLLEALLDQPTCDASTLDRDGDSAIHWAAYKDNVPALAALARVGMRTELPDAYGSTCLHLAAGQGAHHAAW